MSTRIHEMSAQSHELDAVELSLQPPTPNYIGKVNFGTGSIESNSSPADFMAHLEYVASSGLKFAADFSQLYGGCMDGRGNIMTEASTPAPPRPKVIGGPSWYAWSVASIGNFSIIDGVDDPLEQFEIVNTKLNDSGLMLGMHRVCGAMRGSKSVAETYIEGFDNAAELMGTAAKRFALHENGLFLSPIRDRLHVVRDQLEVAGSRFSEEAMADIVKSIANEEAIVHLAVDDDHENHGHEEQGLVFNRVHNAIVYKNKVIEQTGIQNFYQNTGYATRITQALARTPTELAKGIIIGDQLPIIGVATLGKGQHVGEITGQMFVA